MPDTVVDLDTDSLRSQLLSIEKTLTVLCLWNIIEHRWVTTPISSPNRSPRMTTFPNNGPNITELPIPVLNNSVSVSTRNNSRIFVRINPFPNNDAISGSVTSDVDAHNEADSSLDTAPVVVSSSPSFLLPRDNQPPSYRVATSQSSVTLSESQQESSESDDGFPPSYDEAVLNVILQTID